MEIKSQSVLAADGDCLSEYSFHRTSMGVDSYIQNPRPRLGTARLCVPFGQLRSAADSRVSTVDLRGQHQRILPLRHAPLYLTSSVQDLNSRTRLDPQAVSEWINATPFAIAPGFAYSYRQSTGRDAGDQFFSVAHLEIALCVGPIGASVAKSNLLFLCKHLSTKAFFEFSPVDLKRGIAARRGGSGFSIKDGEIGQFERTEAPRAIGAGWKHHWIHEHPGFTGPKCCYVGLISLDVGIVSLQVEATGYFE